MTQKKKPRDLRAGDVTGKYTVLTDAEILGEEIVVKVRLHGDRGVTTRSWDTHDSLIQLEVADD